MASSKPSVGDVVLTAVDPRTNNGSPEAAAIVTRVLEVDKDVSVNLRVLLDGDETLNLRNVPFGKKPKDDKDEESDENAPATAPSVVRAAWSK